MLDALRGQWQNARMALLTVAQAVKRSRGKLTRQQVYILYREKKLRGSGGPILIDEDSLDRYLDQQKTPAGHKPCTSRGREDHSR